MDFRDVLQAFGGSIFPGDLRGDYKKSLLDITSLEAEQQGSGCVTWAQFASTSLLQAVHALLTGQHVSCRTHLDHLLNLHAGKPNALRWAYRAHAYLLLNWTYSRHPPLFHDVDSTLLKPTDILWKNERDDELREQCTFFLFSWETNADLRSIDQYEGRYCIAMWLASQQYPNGTHFVLKLEFPAFHDGEQHRDDEERILSSRTLFRELTEEAPSLGLRGLVPSILTVLLSIYRRDRDINFARALMDTIDGFKTHRDQSILARWKMIEGDNLFSPPSTNPVFLNVVPVEYAEFGTEYSTDTVKSHGREAPLLNHLITDEERQEDTNSVEWFAERDPLGNADSRSTMRLLFSFAGANKALTCYEEAKALLGDHNHQPRLLAGLWLRSAAILKVMSMHPYWIWRNPHEGIVERRNGLKIAMSYASQAGDILLMKLVHYHQLVEEGFSSENSIASKAIGTWCAENDSTGFGHRLALWAHRTGDYFRYDCGSVLGAMNCYELARTTLHTLRNFELSWLKVSIAEATMEASYGAIKHAQISLGYVLGSHRRLDTQIRKHMELRPGWSKTGAKLRIYCTQIVCRAVLYVFSHAPEDLARGADLAAELVKDFGEEGTAAWVSHLLVIINSRRALASVFKVVSRQALDKDSEEVLIQQLALLTTSSADAPLSRKLMSVETYLAMDEPERAVDQMHLINNDDKYAEGTVYLDAPACDMFSSVQKLDDLKAMEAILGLLVRLKLFDRAAELKKDIERLWPGYFCSVSAPTNVLPWQRCLWAGLVEESQGDISKAFQYFIQSLTFVEDLRSILLDFNSRRSVFHHADVGRIYICVARTCLAMEEILGSNQKFRPPFFKAVQAKPDLFEVIEETIGLYYQQMTPHRCLSIMALRILELGRATSLLELAGSDSAEFQRTVDWLEAYEKQTAWIELHVLTRRDESEELEYVALNEEMMSKKLGNVIQGREARQAHLKMLPRKLITFDMIRHAIPCFCLVVHISISDDGMMIFYIDETGMQIGLQAPDATSAKIRYLVSVYVDGINQKGANSPIKQLDSVAQNLASLVLEPAESILLGYKHIIFVPSGDLNRFPLSVLPLNGKPLLLQVATYQVPSLSVLYELKLRFQGAVRSPRFSVIARPGRLREELQNKEKRMPLGAIEALYVALCGRTTPLRAENLTRKDFQRELAQCDILHICTHGKLDVRGPMHASLSLKERLRVFDLASVRTKATAVILSACLAGSGRSLSSDDVLGFSHTILGAGANLFMGCLWTVNEVTTLIHMVLFYTIFYSDRSEQPYTFAEAWHEATVLLHGLDVEGAERILLKIELLWDEIEDRGQKPNEFVKNGKARLQEARAQLRSKDGEPLIDFKHPYSWAAFNIVGNAHFGTSPILQRDPESLDILGAQGSEAA